MLQPLWTSSQVYSTWTPAPSCSRLSQRHEKPKKQKQLFLKSCYGSGLHVVIVFLFNSCFLGFACLCCKAVGCLWVSGKKWLCLHKQSLTDGYWQMLIEQAAQTRVLTVLVNSNTALCRWPVFLPLFRCGRTEPVPWRGGSCHPRFSGYPAH